MAPLINIFIQARLSSERFPGKVLAPLHQQPLIKHVVNCARSVREINQVVVLTSDNESDDPLVAYLEKIPCCYVRGDLENVFVRFQKALRDFPCDYFVRLSADSPFINSDLIQFMISQLKNSRPDLISNVSVRTFPKGQSVEIAKTSTFLAIDQTALTAEEREHVFPYFYSNCKRFHCLSVKNEIDESQLNFCVDTVQDLKNLSASCVYHFKQPVYVE